MRARFINPTATRATATRARPGRKRGTNETKGKNERNNGKGIGEVGWLGGRMDGRMRIHSAAGAAAAAVAALVVACSIHPVTWIDRTHAQTQA